MNKESVSICGLQMSVNILPIRGDEETEPFPVASNLALFEATLGKLGDSGRMIVMVTIFVLL